MKHQGRIMHVYEHIYIYMYPNPKLILDKITSDIIRWIWVNLLNPQSFCFPNAVGRFLGSDFDRLGGETLIQQQAASWESGFQAGQSPGSRECRESKMSKFDMGKFGPKKMEESKFGVPTAQMSSFQLWGQLGFQLRGKRIISTKTIKTSEGALHLKICQPAVQPSPSLPGTNRRPACVKLRKLHRRSHNLLT